MKPILSLTLLAILLPLASCKQEEAPMQEAAAPEAQAPSAAPPGAPIGPISSRGEGAVPDAAAGQTTGIDFDLPANWKAQTPETNMRLAQAEIPGSAGPGQLAVFFFGPGGGGGVQDNIQRWIDQVEPAPGANPQPQTFETGNGFRVTWVEVAGTVKPSMTGAGPTTDQPNSRLLGAVVEGPGGPWFFKATGPDATLAAERESFLNMLRSVRGQ